jgi:catechol 2,3-dioxygenase-like lactoylglutathione lyase family enzyme
VIQGIEHTAIAAADAASLASWYVDVLGFAEVYRSPNAIFVKTANGTMIEIINAEGARPDAGMKTPGIRHLALTVGDFEAAYAQLKAKNVAFLGEPQESKGNHTVFFTDPEGNILHLLFRPKPLA